MKIINGQIEYELVQCWNCNGTGIVKKFEDCPLNNIKMKGKTCPHCQTKNKYHHSIEKGLTYCYVCQGKRRIWEDKFTGASMEVRSYIADHLEYTILNDNTHKAKCESMEGEGGLLVGMFEQLFGASDYIDHRFDSLGKLKTLVQGSIKNGGHQTIHFLNNDGTLKTKCLLVGYNGGYHGKLI